MAQTTHNIRSLEKGDYERTEILKLKEPLSFLPPQILELHQLRQLDLSGTGLAQLPSAISQLVSLRVAFFSDCRFNVYPVELAACPALEMVAFRGNGMASIPENAFPAHLRWLILTNNEIECLPTTIGQCTRLQKCMLSGNRLKTLPTQMVACQKLGLLRLAANQIEEIPEWLLEMPELAFLSLSGNPCCRVTKDTSSGPQPGLTGASWEDVTIQMTLGEGASGTIYRAAVGGQEVAVKLFKGDVTSDGTPMDEMMACITAGQHQNLIDTLGRIINHPEQKTGLVMQLIPNTFTTLGLPPSMQSCTRDCFLDETRLTDLKAVRLLEGIAAAARHIHERGIAHGDLYAHNILINPEGSAILGDLGAATIYGASDGLSRFGERLQKLDVLAFGHLVEDALTLVPSMGAGQATESSNVELRESLRDLHGRCTTRNVQQRPLFVEIHFYLVRLGNQLASQDREF